MRVKRKIMILLIFFSFGKTLVNVNILIDQNKKKSAKILITFGCKEFVRKTQTYLFHIMYLRVFESKSM